VNQTDSAMPPARGHATTEPDQQRHLVTGAGCATAGHGGPGGDGVHRPGGSSSRQPWRSVAASLAAVVLAGGVGATIGLLQDRPADGTTGLQALAPVSAAEAARLERAEQELVRRCMGRAGFRYWPILQGPDPVPFTYVIDDVAWADRNGYGTALRQAAATQSAQSPNARYFASLTPARQEAALDALHGPEPVGLTATLPNGLVAQHSDRGCASEAQRTLYGDLAAWYASTKLVENLAGERYGRVVSDRRFRAGEPAWSACMRRAGYAFATPEDAHARFADPEGPGSAERRQASVEARCATATGLGALARRLDAEHAGRQREQHRALLATRHALQRRALPVAERLDIP
jgi:hypothetical protein